MPRIFKAPPGFVLNPDYLVPELRAQRDALLEALREHPCCTGSCRQGRDCPQRLRTRSTREQAISILLCAVLLAVVLLMTWWLR